MVFVRSRTEQDIPGARMRAMAEMCWPFHEAMLEKLMVRVVVCFGGTVGSFVRAKLGGGREVDRFVEENSRRWTSRTFQTDAAGGVRVVQVTHPARADWCSPAADVSPLVARALAVPG